MVSSFLAHLGVDHSVVDLLGMHSRFDKMRGGHLGHSAGVA
jgi:hypothetical protein